ncbi:hypothetical protein LEP1GSC103_1006 [Leptospira borgpetersenii serovar Javanica str. UI 09931]|uniref:Uncharacterized protein n=5 Tax=Leptospira borgpetersenii TaxID=174 RepID=M3HXE0_LEPBO|nr:hypothetical protein [Leptospira borgpetersenii]ALO27150.1 hypothetical protein LBBP_02937 [Leptospira borgpetersenii serovar Ballum]EKP15641.1 hypothetical protein LEP1GSC128_0028 [Leptospira borgpetersenii str. 200801926]EKQ91601.1 hypothetical protein LEP1GSC101_0129 [Leptospira borgpetersenii str. UI 09149]EKR00710.1 hypothetical protein LEP1GSC121_0697 [Leptospira borgpetersenii serovar Castellonis str. 200801910]EMG02280.1 hypothetical protein LEP1GSC123_0846 [Leptospira borgpeterseni
MFQNVGTIAVIREDSDKIEWFWDTLLFFSMVGTPAAYYFR